jgi:hypothetical protein
LVDELKERNWGHLCICFNEFEDLNDFGLFVGW